MNTVVKLLIAVILLGVGGFVAYTSLGNDSGSPQPVNLPGQGDPVVPAPGSNEPGPAPITSGNDVGTETPSNDAPIREEVTPGSMNDALKFAQGVRGRVIDDLGTPVVGAQISLRSKVDGGIFVQAIRKTQGLGNAPIASAVTDQDGSFAIGLRTVPDKAQELWVTSPRTVDFTIASLELTAGEWEDVKDVKVTRGCTLFGQITAEETGVPLVGALVLATSGGLPTMGAAPGREDGIPATTDANGMYRFDSLNPGFVTVAAEAEGHARITVQQVSVTVEAATEQNLALPVGRKIEGWVTDATGNGVGGAQIAAISLSTKTPMTLEIRADERGFFVLENLVDAPFQLTAKAAGFRDGTLSPIQAGETEQQIVLEKQGGARVRVRASNGKAINAFHVSVLRHFKQNDSLGAAHDIPPRAVQRRDLDSDGAFTFTGMNPGDYAFEINTGGYAKTRSDVFTIAPNTEPALIDVTMKNGGKIVGQVFAPDGSPLQGVQVSTLPPKFVEVPFLRDLQHLMTTEISRATVKTNEEGRYVLSQLAPANYKLKFTHADAFDAFVNDVVVADEQTTQCEPVKLAPGTLVYGTILVDGQPGVGVKVSISATPKQAEPGKPPVAIATIGFAEEAVTDAEGKYRFKRRVPPGDYTLRAGRQGGNIFAAMVDFQKTEQKVTFQQQDSFEYSPGIVSN